jgi:hypothetical protein
MSGFSSIVIGFASRLQVHLISVQTIFVGDTPKAVAFVEAMGAFHEGVRG